MKIQQISLFLENKPGHLSAICRTLAKAGINIATISLADTQQFGILRLIVAEARQAVKVLETAGLVVHVNDVVAVAVDDRPGGMAEVLEIIEQGRINIEYMYAFTFHRKDRAVLVFRFDDPDAAVQLLLKNERTVLGAVELFESR